MLLVAFVILATGCDNQLTLTTLSGDDDCDWAAEECNRCARSVSAQFDQLQNDYKSAGRIRFDGYAWPTPDHLLHRIAGSMEHVQSIGRIPGLGNDEYMVFTHSTDSDEDGKEGALAVVRMGAGQNTGGGPFGGMPHGDGADQDTSNRTVARAYAGNDHPGGLSVLGRYVYVAQWCQEFFLIGNDNWCPESSPDVHGMGFSVYDVGSVHLNNNINSSPPIHLAYRHVYDEDWIEDTSTASIAAVKLSDGQFLVALGRSGGEEYGFYLAEEPTGPFDFQVASSISHKGENATIVTECRTGDLYLFQIGAETLLDDVDRVHLYRLELNDDEIDIIFVKSRTFHCRGSDVDGAGDWCNFDGGTGIYVTPQGRLILYATEKEQSSHGNIRLVEFH